MVRIASPFAVFLFLLTFTPSLARDLENPKPHSDSETHHHDTVSFTIDTVDPVPLTFLRFRPINRHFQPRRCHHHRHRREIPYGNDAILSNHAASRRIPYGNDAILSDHAASRQIHRRWSTFQPLTADTSLLATVDRLDSNREHPQHHHHHHHRMENWFAKRFRKFMNLF